MRVRDCPYLAYLAYFAYFAKLACGTKHSCDTGHHSAKPVVQWKHFSFHLDCNRGRDDLLHHQRHGANQRQFQVYGTLYLVGHRDRPGDRGAQWTHQQRTNKCYLHLEWQASSF
jgi:hypothetical protein